MNDVIYRDCSWPLRAEFIAVGGHMCGMGKHHPAVSGRGGLKGSVRSQDVPGRVRT